MPESRDPPPLSPESVANRAPEYPGRDLEAMVFAANYHAWILDEIGPYLGGRVIEVGAGSGSVTALLRQHGVRELAALEPSAEMFEVLSAQYTGMAGVSALNSPLGTSGLAGSGEWDSIVYLNVLEHIQDDVGELRTARSTLREGGHALLFVPALPWLYSRFDASIGHFRRYRKIELEGRVLQAGFEIVHSRYFDIAGILPWYVSMVLMKGSLSPRKVALYDRLVTPLMRRIERHLPLPAGKNVLLVARARS